MAECLQTKVSNCKNCYKCIRHCPVKSLRFTENQAHIIREECVLCGECYVVCPQNAKTIRNDVEEVKNLISSGKQVYVSLAPSSIAWYQGKSLVDIEKALQKLGFIGVGETAIGATIVKRQYEDLIRSKKNDVIISSCCHTVNTLIQRHYMNALPYLAPVVSPMLAHAMTLKRMHKDCEVVFIGPCISKKEEAEKYGGIVHSVLTFDELDEWLSLENITIGSKFSDNEKGKARAFPTSGGIIRSMTLDPDFNYIVIDGMDNCINALKDIGSGKLSKCFIEMSACSGSCIGGPIMNRSSRNPIMDILSITSATGEKDFDVLMPDTLKLKKEITLEPVSKVIPAGMAIDEILKKMGKNTKEQELNCGSCGYNTCRDKAVAVFMGKADLSMCLPYLKEKAESFSDTIINNTPNGIIVLSDQLEIQQLNISAREILNLPSEADVIGSPVDRVLDPVDYVTALNDEKNIYDKRKYLAEYQKYIEETIIYDKEYHIIMIIMKDVSYEEQIKSTKDIQCKAAIEITDKVVEKQMRVVQEIALLLGETTAETKIALTKLKETLCDE